MKNCVFLIFFIMISGCGILPKYQAPYLIPDITLQGEHWVNGNLIQSSKKRYWLAYEKALESEGYLLHKGDNEEYAGAKIKVPGNFKTYDLDLKKELPLTQRRLINKKFFEDGYVYAASICTGYFQQADYTKSQRAFARKETNISGGLISAALGLAEASVKTVSGVGVAFSALDSSFDAYDNSFLVSPQLGLLEKAVKNNMANVYVIESAKNFDSVSQVITSLSKITTLCSQTGMQAFVDESVNQTLQKNLYASKDLNAVLLQKLEETKEIENALKAAKEKEQSLLEVGSSTSQVE